MCRRERAIADVLISTLKGISLKTNDINPDVKALTNIPAQKLLQQKDSEYDWIITNPPFNLATEIIPLAYEKATQGIVMLLRLSYLEPCNNRKDWLSQHPPNILLINKRVSFTGDGKSDSCTTAWFVWLKNSDKQIINFIY